MGKDTVPGLMTTRHYEAAGKISAGDALDSGAVQYLVLSLFSTEKSHGVAPYEWASDQLDSSETG